jgi:hypothetical protein
MMVSVEFNCKKTACKEKNYFSGFFEEDAS